MKKTLIRAIVFVIVFLVTIVCAEQIMNKGHENITMDMEEATLPLVVMERGDSRYNELHGYRSEVDIALQREQVTVLEDDRSIGFVVETFGKKPEGITVEVRSLDGSRLIERDEIQDISEEEGEIHRRIQLKDLIEKNEEYMLIFKIRQDGEEIRYYSRILWSDEVFVDEKIAFVMDFHRRLYDKEEAREIAKYLEPNSLLEDNQSFHKVNIHSSFRQITWGDLNIRQETDTSLRLKEINASTASFLTDFLVSTDDGKGNKTFYQVKEFYRVRYGTDVQYLLDYERTMTQIPDMEKMYANDKLLLGIADTDVRMQESDDGNVVAFVDAGQLFSYNITSNSLAAIFRFYDDDHFDNRTLYDQHDIKILDVTEGGNVEFAIYGYMNRGRHEGEVGIQVYLYNSILNTIEEIVYIPYDKTFDILDTELQQLLYLSKEQKLYMLLENKVFEVDLTKREYGILAQVEQDGLLQISEENRIMVSLVLDEKADINHCRSISIRNLNNESEKIINADAGESIRPLGFMGEDIIYGIARNDDITVENTGRVFFPMYKLCICDAEGHLLKEYRQQDVYIIGCSVESNQITMKRMKRTGENTFAEMEDDHITNNTESDPGKNMVAAADIDIYERYVQIQTRKAIDTKTIKMLTPKEVVFEGGRTMNISSETPMRYYVYGGYGVDGIYNLAATAVNRAYEESGVVRDVKGEIVWQKTTRAVKNQIMAIKEEETGETGSLAVCLDTILKYEGITSNSEYLLEKGQSIIQILESNLEGYKILDLTGCSLDSVLYFVNQDIPVLALLKDGDAVLLTGFNDREIVILEPTKGSLYKKSLNDTIVWMEENNNSFITYQR